MQSAKEVDKKTIQAHLEKHHSEAEAGYASLKEDKERAKQSWAGRVRKIDSDICSIDAINVYSFDFEQNLPCPNIQSSEVFYIHQMLLWSA